MGDYVRLHARWIRHDFAWDAIEPVPGTYNWAGFDQLVKSAHAHGISVIATLTYTPVWANGGHSDHTYEPTSAIEFGNFARAVTARYAPRGVHAYEIWNEPNISFWQPKPDPLLYTQILCAAYKRIHAVDPQTWLRALYTDGAKPCFDAVGHHPYIDASTQPDDLGNAWYLMYGAYPADNLRQIMIANHDGAKRIWATEVGCRRSLGDTQVASRLAHAFQLWSSYRWAGVLAWFTYWDPNQYGLVNDDWTPRPAWYAYQTGAARYPHPKNTALGSVASAGDVRLLAASDRHTHGVRSLGP
jgi:hypothetical protein